MTDVSGRHHWSHMGDHDTDQNAPDDDESFAWFFTAEYPSVVRLLGVVVRDSGTAEELAQEAFIRLYRHWGRVRRFDSPEAWVRRVALNRAFSWRRREARRPALELAAAGHPGASDERTDDHLEVIRAVRSLPPRDRALVALYHLEDRSLDEVATVLGLTPGAAKVALHRARQRLAAQLSQEMTS
jgi:RNA polymerase sigma factor (sigma-70 family)